MFSIVGAILAIGFLIIVHEAGHYFVARWCNMRVDRFSIGFGPPILSWKRGETDFTIGPIPFGGFVQISGMISMDEVDDNDPRQYPNRPVWQRFAAIFAGPATNYLTAIVLAFGLYSIIGVPTGTNYLEVGPSGEGVVPVAGLEVGDRILKVGDEVVYLSFEGKKTKGLPAYVEESKGAEMTFTVLRDGKEMVIKATPTMQTPPGEDKPRLLLGIGLVGVPEARVSAGFFGNIGNALIYPVNQTKIIGQGLYDIATRKVEGELAGPVGIATIAKQQFDAGWVAVVTFLMVLNVYIGLFNLLPLPALDGGRLVFLAYEMATRRRANPKIEATVHMVGIMALLLVMVLVTYKDIAKLF